MTRVQVLKRARKLLLDGGYMPPSKNGMAMSATGPVAVEHPDAVRFTLLGAIRRAIFELCEEDYRKRDRLYMETTEAISLSFASVSAEY